MFPEGTDHEFAFGGGVPADGGYASTGTDAGAFLVAQDGVPACGWWAVGTASGWPTVSDVAFDADGAHWVGGTLCGPLSLRDAQQQELFSWTSTGLCDGMLLKFVFP